jgi:hypothetical protein
MNTSHNTMSKGLPTWVEQGLAKDPAFRVLTMDGTGWIDPFSGDIVPAASGHQQAARSHLRKSQSWRTGQARPLRDLLYLRWLFYLRPQLKSLPQLRVIRSGRWLNPYTGRWQAPPPDDWQSDLKRFAEFLAGVLCDCPEAQAGRMLDSAQIEALASRGPAGQDPGPLAMPGQAATRIMPAAPSAKPIAPQAGFASPATATPLKNSIAKPVQAAAASKRQPLPEATPVRSPSIAGRSKMKTDLVAIRQAFIKQLRKPPRVEGFQLVLQYSPHAPIPRDFYDVIEPVSGLMHIVLGHVSGDGPGAALLAGALLDSVREHGRQHRDPIDLLCAINDSVRVDQVPGCLAPMCVLTLSLADRKVRCVVAGHPPPVIVSQRRDSVLRQFRGGGASIGSLSGADFRKRLQAVETELVAGDILALPGVGLAHAADPEDPDAGRLRVYGHLVANLKRPLGEMVPAVMRDVRGEERPRDDLALIALRTKDESWLMETRD